MTAEPLRVLVVEDDPDDADLLVRELKRAGFAPTHQRVESAPQLREALEQGPWELVISDYVLPGFSCSEAIAAVRAHDPDLPFLVLSGTQGEETAVEVMRAGAQDYLVKQNLSRLGPAVRRELRESQGRREKRALQAQLVQSQKMEALGALAGGVAHDFNNVLAGILGNAELCREELRDHPARAYLQHILDAAGRAQDLVRQILSVSRQREPRREPTALAAVALEALRLLRATVPRCIELGAELAPDLPQVLADPGQVHQVLMNLCTNATQAIGHRPGHVTVGLAAVEAPDGLPQANPPLPAGAYVRLTVADDGPGMEARTLARMFEPFFTTKPPGQGTGLGLAVVDNLVRAHQGGIFVASAPGQGSRFEVWFPALPRAAHAAVAPPSEAVPLGSGQRLMLVEDEATLLWVAQRMLVRLGYHVTCFADPVAALAAFEADPVAFDAVLTDVSLPRMTGAELLARLLQTRPDLPASITTGNPDDPEAERALKLGARALVEKPYTLAALARAVQRTLLAPEA